METIREAGFKEVRIIDEASFPNETLENDHTTKATIENLNISPQEARKAVSSVISVIIQGINLLRE